MRLNNDSKKESSNMAGVREVHPEDFNRVLEFIQSHWGGDIIVSRGKVHRIEPQTTKGFLIEEGSEIKALLTYVRTGDELEILTLDSNAGGKGYGSALIRAVIEKAKSSGCSRVWLITSNDNIEAIKVYQKRGFALVAVHRDAITEARKLKPTIPLTGMHGIEIRDEVELEVSFKQKQKGAG